MKYKAGDFVKIKTWKEMEEEFGLITTAINCPGKYIFTPCKETELNRLFPDRIVKIISIEKDFYKIKGKWGNNWSWNDTMIKRIATDPKEKILSRFDILDIR